MRDDDGCDEGRHNSGSTSSSNKQSRAPMQCEHPRPSHPFCEEEGKRAPAARAPTSDIPTIREDTRVMTLFRCAGKGDREQGKGLLKKKIRCPSDQAARAQQPRDKEDNDRSSYNVLPAALGVIKARPPSCPRRRRARSSSTASSSGAPQRGLRPSTARATVRGCARASSSCQRCCRGRGR